MLKRRHSLLCCPQTQLTHIDTNRQNSSTAIVCVCGRRTEVEFSSAESAHSEILMNDLSTACLSEASRDGGEGLKTQTAFVPKGAASGEVIVMKDAYR